MFEGPTQAKASKGWRDIWVGTLEWFETQSGIDEQPIKMMKEIPCEVSSRMINGDGDSEIRGSWWPPKLAMELLPVNITRKLGAALMYDKYIKFLPFYLQNCGALKSLFGMLETGCSGFVHLGGPEPFNKQYALLVYLKNKKRSVYLGIVPSDQTGFCEFVSRELRKHEEELQVMQSQELAGAAGFSLAPQEGLDEALSKLMSQLDILDI